MVPDDWGPRAPVVEEELDDDVMGAIRTAAWSGNRARDGQRDWRRRAA